MSSSSIFILAIAYALSAPCLAVAADDDAATPQQPTLQQVKQNASQGQSPETTSQVNQYVDDHQTEISAIINGYVNYIRRIEHMTANTVDGQPSLTSTSGTDSLNTSAVSQRSPSSQSSSLSTQAVIGTQSRDSASGYSSVQAGVSPQSATDTSGVISTQSGSIQASSGLQQGALQTSSGLQTSTLQTSDTLQTSHLSAYPSLPDVEPVTTINGSNLSAAQKAYADKVRKENTERKKELMALPDGSFR